VTARAWTLTVPADAYEWATTQLHTPAQGNTLVMHAGSGSAAKNWTGFAALAERWRRHGRVIWIVGPAEDLAPLPLAAGVVRDQPLPYIAALLQRASLYVGNDSGVSHLAAIAGARGLALFGPSDPIIWRPLGLHVLRGAPAADACADHGFCTHRLSVELTHAVLLSLRASAA
jgi:ADP-heptose:LPS heptosyltransferase